MQACLTSRRGASILGMEPDAFGRLLADTRQKEALSRVEYLISRLRELGDPKTSPKEYRDFHSFLRSEIHKAERVQAEATVANRLDPPRAGLLDIPRGTWRFHRRTQH